MKKKERSELQRKLSSIFANSIFENIFQTFSNQSTVLKIVLPTFLKLFYLWIQQKNNNQHSASYNSSSKQKIQLFGQIYLPQNLAQQQNGGCWEKTVLPTFETVFMRQLILYMKSSLTNFHVQNLSFSQFYRN